MKVKKAILKTILYMPFYLAVVAFYHLVYYQTVIDRDIIIVPVLLSILTVYINIFEYDKYNDLPPGDYLESRHQKHVEYSDEAWMACKHFNTHLVSYDADVLEYSKDEIEYKIKFNILIGQLNSILAFKHRNDKIEISIKKQYITFLPDRGVNLKIIRQVEKKLKFYAEYGLN